MDDVGQILFMCLLTLNIVIYPFVIIKAKQKLLKIKSHKNKSYSKMSVWIILFIIYASVEQIVANILLLFLTFYTFLMKYEDFESSKRLDTFVRILTYVLNLLLIGVIC
jgi:hypothetical protein